MSRENRESRLWGVAALLMWFAFFALGLFPDFFFDYLREQGEVVPNRALTNSVVLLYLGLVAYFFSFVVRAARAADLSSAVSQMLAVQLSIMALMAFMPLKLELIFDYLRLSEPFWRRAILGVCVLKVASWLYLLSLLIRYYLWAGAEVFRQMAPLFPSAHDESGGEK